MEMLERSVALLRPTFTAFAAPCGVIPLELNWMSPPELEVPPVSRFRLVGLAIDRVVVWLRTARAIAGEMNARTGMIGRNRSACFICLSPPMSRTQCFVCILQRAVIDHRKTTA